MSLFLPISPAMSDAIPLKIRLLHCGVVLSPVGMPRQDGAKITVFSTWLQVAFAEKVSIAGKRNFDV